MLKKSLYFFMLMATGIAMAQDYTLGDTSTLSVSGTSTLHDWTVNAETVKAKLTLDGEKATGLSLEVPVADMHSERGATMDKKMYNALKMDAHPNVTFTAQDLDLSGDTISGELVVAGVAKTVAIPVSIDRADGNIHIKGSQEIVLQEYDMEPPTAMFGSIVVGDNVTVHFDFHFVRP